MGIRANASDVANEYGLPEMIQGLDKAGVVTITRRLLSLSKTYGSNAMSYHFAPRESSLRTNAPYLYFATGSALSRNRLSDRVKKGIGRCHSFVLRRGRPVTLLEMIPGFKKVDPELTEIIIRGVNARGVIDEYLIPVYGPFGAKAVISFGFPCEVTAVDENGLRTLEAASNMAHANIVRYVVRGKPKTQLSERERSVIHWIARGKSNTDISDILGISQASVDTYTRRMFKKLGVNDRISAVVKAIEEGNVDPRDPTY